MKRRKKQNKTLFLFLLSLIFAARILCALDVTFLSSVENWEQISSYKATYFLMWLRLFVLNQGETVITVPSKALDNENLSYIK